MKPSSGSRSVRAVALQPLWRLDDFRSPASFRAWMRGQLEQAKPQLAVGQPNLVVLTELNGLPLLLCGAPLTRRAPSFNAALGLLLLKHLPSALLLAARERVSPVRALQLALAPGVAALYLSTCRDLAREYGVYLACGTAPLPHFEVRKGHLVPIGGALYNQAVLLDPQGALIGLADKVYLTGAEGRGGLDFAAGRLADLRVFRTPAGDLGVATSLDAFKPDLIAQLDGAGATVLLQPDANGSPWTGLEQESPGHRDQPLAWLESAWTAVQGATSIRYAINPMVVGNLFDLAFDGQSAIVARVGEALQEGSYVLTAPRPGFLALLPWVAEGSPDELREVGAQLAPGSGHPLENQYRTGVLSADLHLPPQTREPQRLRPFEAAVNAYLSGEATLKSTPLLRLLGLLWPTFWTVTALYGVRQLARRRVKRGVVATVLGALLALLAWF